MAAGWRTGQDSAVYVVDSPDVIHPPSYPACPTARLDQTAHHPHHSPGSPWNLRNRTGLDFKTLGSIDTSSVV
jgi:hypothetical protein